MREQAKRAVGALILAVFLAVWSAPSSAAGEVNGSGSQESAAELLLLTMLPAAAMSAPPEPAAGTTHLVVGEGPGSPAPQIACAAPAKAECSQPHQSPW
jgi:hypothetical protein